MKGGRERRRKREREREERRALKRRYIVTRRRNDDDNATLDLTKASLSLFCHHRGISLLSVYDVVRDKIHKVLNDIPRFLELYFITIANDRSFDIISIRKCF